MIHVTVRLTMQFVHFSSGKLLQKVCGLRGTRCEHLFGKQSFILWFASATEEMELIGRRSVRLGGNTQKAIARLAQAQKGRAKRSRTSVNILRSIGSRKKGAKVEKGARERKTVG